MFSWLSVHVVVCVCAKSFIERNCVGEENVEVNYAFFQRGGVHIHACVCVGGDG